jgi:hypothetical protein
VSFGSKTVRWIGWILTGIIVAFMLFDGAIQLIAFDFVTQGMIEFGLPESYARPLGIVTLACTLLYAWPRTSVLGAVLLTGFLGGTIATHMPRPEPLLPHIVTAMVMGAIVWGGLWLRDPQLRALLPWRRARTKIQSQE